MRLASALVSIAIVLASSAATAAKDPVKEREELEHILRRTQERVDQADKEETPEYLRRQIPQEFLDEAAQYANKVKEIQRDAIYKAGIDSGIPEQELAGTALDKKGAANLDAGRIAVFISASMPREQIRDLLKTWAREDVSVMIRGLLPGTQNFLETQKALAELAKGIDPRPDILLNPVAFTNHNVTVVPTVIIAGDAPKSEALRAEGSINIGWLEERLHAAGKPINLGRIGPVFEIAERDLLLVLQERFNAIDWEERARKARDRFWTKQKFVELPAAREDSVRRIDPTVVVTEDVVNPRDKTQFIAHAGERHNPLEKVPLTRRVIVFDARDPKQLAIVRELRKKPLPNKLDVYITTGVDREKGWDQHAEISQEFTSPLFLLNPDLKTMLRLRAVPSVITAEGKELVIQEIKVPL